MRIWSTASTPAQDGSLGCLLLNDILLPRTLDGGQRPYLLGPGGLYPHPVPTQGAEALCSGPGLPSSPEWEVTAQEPLLGLGS